MNAQQILTGALIDAIAEQPWWRRYAGTVTAAATGLVALIGWVTATWTSLPPAVSTILGAVLMVASVVAQRATRNGLTPRGAQDTVDALRDRVDTAITDTVQSAVEQVADAMSRDLPQPAVDVIEMARERGWTEHDPRFLGLAAEDAARRFLAALTGRHAR